MITSVKKITTMPAYNILECDGENLQAHIAASMSLDPTLSELFLKGGDFHSNNAYEIMAKYQLFTPFEVAFEDGSKKEIMEWESFDLPRAKHILVKDLLAGDEIDGKKVVSLRFLPARKITRDEYVKNAKKGKLKDLRTTAKFCFARGTEILTTKGWLPIETIAENSIKDFGLLYEGDLKVIGRDGKPKEIYGTINKNPSPMLEFELEDGTLLKVTEDHEVLVNRDGKEIKVLAKDVQENDDVLDYTQDSVLKVFAS